MNINLLEQSWHNLLTRLNADLPLGKTVLENLIAVYSTPNRHYHNLYHVRDLLAQAKSVRHVAECLPAIELAAWFHDCIYDSQAKDNEMRSAVYAESTLTKLNVPIDLVKLVKQIIISTQRHQPLADNIDNLIFLDLDLSILGTSSNRYLQYATAIRKEYEWLSDRNYQQGRKQVLSNFLAREKIYYTDFFAQKLERQARINLRDEINALI